MHDPRQEWNETASLINGRLVDWRKVHGQASWREIDQAVDTELARLRTQLLTDMAEMSAAADFRGAADRPRCAQCGRRLQASGQQVRKLLTVGQQVVQLERTYGRCPACRTGFFPPG